VKTANDSPLERPIAADPEVLDRPTRRQFSAEYKRRILAECDTAPPGATGAILRREGLYSSHLRDWRAARDRAQTSALSPKKRGPKAEPKSAHELENVRLRRQLERTQRKLERAELVIDFQKKVAELLGIALPMAENDDHGGRNS
jgi:transposase-like protein